MHLDALLANGQSQTSARVFGGKKWLKYFFAYLVTDSIARIGDLYFDLFG